MTDQEAPRRTVALLHSDHDPAEFEALIQRRNLDIAYTVYTEAAAVLAALIAVQHALERLADAVVIPHLDVLEPDTPWWAVTEVADLITGTRAYPLRSAKSAAVRKKTVIALGFVVAIGLPLVVLVLAVVWPEPEPEDRTVKAIHQRIESEDGPPTAP